MLKNLSKLTFPITLFLSVTACSSGSGEQTQSTPPAQTPTVPTTPSNNWVDAFDEQMNNRRQESNIPGMAVALIKGNQTKLAKGYGLRDVENQLPVNEQTLFHIASTHKAINSTLIATLVDDALIEWNEPVVTYFPEFALSQQSASESVNITHLLSMSSGIADSAEDNLPFDATSQALFSLLRAEPLLAAPGEVLSYSNISAALAGYIGVIASFSDNSKLIENYATLLNEKVLQPIGMNRSTIFRSQAELDGNLSKSYRVNSDGNPELLTSYDNDQDILAPSGSLKSSAEEMALFVATHLSNGMAPNQNRIASSANLTQTYQPVLEGYAMGWEEVTYRDSKVIMHTGNYDGFVSVIALLPQHEVGLVLLANTEKAQELTEQAHEMLIDILAQNGQ